MQLKQYLVRQELSEFTLVELVGYEDDETRSPLSFSSWVVHSVYEYWNFGSGGYYLAEDCDDDIDCIAEELKERCQ